MCLAVSRAAADTGQTAFAAGNPVRTEELATLAAADARNAALTARTATRSAVDAAGAAVAVRVATAAAGVKRDEVGDAGAGSARPRRDNVGGGQWRRSDRCSDGPGHHQWFQ